MMTRRNDAILTPDEWERLADELDDIDINQLHGWLASWLGEEKAEELHDFVRSVMVEGGE